MKKIFEFFRRDKIGNPPYDYNFLLNLEKSEYPRYLEKLFKYKTGEELPLLKEWSFKSCRMGICPRGQKFWNYIIDKNKCKTFNQKIQWIKLYGITPLMRDCTDKVKVRDYVRERIGKEYLKPVLQIVRNEELAVRSNNLTSNSSLLTPNLFDKVDFEKLPDSFVIKCNHGCKWHFIIKNKKEYLNTPKLIEITKRQITGWLEQDYSLWGGFELNYRNIKPKILIEPLMRDNLDVPCEEIEVYCFNSIPEFIVRIEKGNKSKTSLYDKNLNITDDVLSENDEKINKPADDILYQSFELSKKLSKAFNFVRVDWMIYQNKLYFEELTFTPFSGFHKLNKNFNVNLGKLINLGES